MTVGSSSQWDLIEEAELLLQHFKAIGEEVSLLYLISLAPRIKLTYGPTLFNVQIHRSLGHY